MVIAEWRRRPFGVDMHEEKSGHLVLAFVNRIGRDEGVHKGAATDLRSDKRWRCRQCGSILLLQECLHPPIFHGRSQSSVIQFGLIGIGQGEITYRLIKDFTLAQIPADGGAVS